MHRRIGLKIDANILRYAFGTYLIYLLINVFVETIIGLPPIMNRILFVIRVVMYFTLFLGSLFSILRSRGQEFLYVLGLLLLFTFNYLCYSKVPERFPSYINTFVFICLPISLFAFKLDGNGILKTLEGIGYTASFLYLVLLVGIFVGRIHMHGYETSIGYAALLPELTIIYGIKKKNGRKSLLSALSVVPYFLFVLLFSSRGPLMVLFSYVIYEIIYYEYKAGSTRKIFITGAIFILVLLLLNNFGDVLKNVQSLMGKRGVTSRTIQLLLSNFTHSSGRDAIYSTVLKQIVKQPFSIRGIASDTDLLIGNQYVHNLFLELLYQFGVVFGGIECVIILYMFLCSLKYQTYESDAFETICAFASVVPLMFSSSLWLNYAFWVWLVRSISKKRRMIQEAE